MQLFVVVSFGSFKARVSPKVERSAESAQTCGSTVNHFTIQLLPCSLLVASYPMKRGADSYITKDSEPDDDIEVM